jgi:hypothetical protein
MTPEVGEVQWTEMSPSAGTTTETISAVFYYPVTAVSAEQWLLVGDVITFT